MKFSEWVVSQLDSKGWSRSEAARRGGISPSLYDKVINEESEPGMKFIKGFAKAFEMTPAQVMRHMGKKQEPNELTQEAMEIFNGFTHDDQVKAVRLLKAIAPEKDITNKNTEKS